jgi:7-cyano-7-deazaguanine synthase in queuosine biosynthesis
MVLSLVTNILSPRGQLERQARFLPKSQSTCTVRKVKDVDSSMLEQFKCRLDTEHAQCGQACETCRRRLRAWLACLKRRTTCL